MGKAGKALRQVLETYNISQNRLAVLIDIPRSTVHRWIHETRDPAGDSVLEIRDALEKINPSAAREFIDLYLGKEGE